MNRSINLLKDIFLDVIVIIKMDLAVLYFDLMLLLFDQIKN